MMTETNELQPIQSYYEEEVHEVIVPKPLEGEKLGLTVQQENGCIVVTRILSGGLVGQIHKSAAEQERQIKLGDIVLEVNKIPVNTPDDLMALVALADKSISFLVRRTPEKELRRYGIPRTPLIRKQVHDKLPPEKRVLCHVRALFDYDPYADQLNPCPDAGLAFERGDILAVLNQDDANWWQATHAGFTAEPAKLIPSQELEEKRKAFVPPEADYTTKIGLCGSLVSRKKRKQFFTSKRNSEFDRAELLLYEEVTLMRPFRRKCIILVGSSGVGRRTLKRRMLESDPEQFEAPLPHTSRTKRPEEDSGVRYWFVDREDMELGIKQHEFLEYGELNGNLYGTRFDSIQAITDQGRVAVLDPSPQSLKLLRSSPDFMPFVVFLAAPGLDEMRHLYDNAKVTNTLMSSGKTLANFERTSSIRHSSRRAKTLESITSLYMEEDVMKNLEESARLERAFGHLFDMVVVNESHDQTFRMVMEGWHNIISTEQWVPSAWVYS